MKKNELKMNLDAENLTQGFQVSDERYNELSWEIKRLSDKHGNWVKVIHEISKQCKSPNEVGIACYICGALSQSTSFSMLSMLEQMMGDDD